MARLDWEKAKRRNVVAPRPSGGSPGRAKRQAALAAFVEQHGLHCFKCGAEKAEWAKTGISPKRGPWAICVRCVSASEVVSRLAVAQAPVSAQPTPGESTAEPTIYSDGACAGNPGRGGYAAVIVGLGSGEPAVVSGGEAHTTNNRMEMRAIIEGLNALDPMPSVEVVADSVYVLKGYREWLPGWIKRGWRTSAKKPVKNADLWAELVAAVARHGQVRWRWTRGHNGDRFNEMADTIAHGIAAG